MISTNAAIAVSYDPFQVALAVFIAVFTSYALLDLAGSVIASIGWSRITWFVGGATAIGIGIWSMQITAIEAVHLSVPVVCYWPTAVYSVLMGILSSAFALYLVTRDRLDTIPTFAGCVILGLGIAAVHYTGMAAMRMAAVRFGPSRVVLSILFAIAFSLAARLLVLDLRHQVYLNPGRKLAGAVVLAAALTSMHFTGIASAHLMPASAPAPSPRDVNISTLDALSISAVTLMLLGLAVFACSVFRRLAANGEELEPRAAERTAELISENQELRKSIAEHELTEAALRGREEIFSQMTSHIQDIFWMMDAISKEIIYISPAFEQVTGRTVSSLLDAPLSYPDILHPEDRSRVIRRLNEAQRTGNFEETLRIVRPNGDVRWVRSRASAVRDAQGSVYRFTGISQDITAEKQAEESARMLAAIVESSDDAIISNDRNGVITSWNAGAERLYGYSAAEAVGQGITVIAPADMSVEHWGIMECLRAGGHIQNYETVRLTKAGQRIQVSLTMSPLLSAEGSVAGACVIARDITEHNKAQEQLRQREADAKSRALELETILDAIPGIALVSRDPSCRTITGSRSTYKVLQSPYGSNLSRSAPESERPIYRIFDTNGRELSADELPLQRAAATGQDVRNVEMIDVFNDGRTKLDFMGNAAPLLDASGKVRGAVGVFIDITERKQADELLRESEGRFRAIFENAGIGMALVDRRGHPIKSNPALTKMLGFTEGELRNMIFTEYTHPDDIDLDWRLYSEVLDGKRDKYEIEKRFIAKDGHVMWGRLVTSLVRNEDGAPTDSVVGMVEDITERKQAERALRESQAELARVARAVAMGELSVTIAHEINQPLTAVVSDVSASLRWLAQEPPEMEEARTALVMAIREANRASDVVAKIRSQLRNRPPLKRRLDLHEVISEVIAMAHIDPHEHRITVKTQLAPNADTVLGDRVQLEQLLLNLIMNSVDAMSGIDDRPRELFIQSAQHPEGVLIKIQDTGKGIEPRYTDSIFEPFFTTKPDGIGMGLSISRSIVEAHGGRLWAIPNSPNGAVFQFTLASAETIA